MSSQEYREYLKNEFDEVGLSYCDRTKVRSNDKFGFMNDNTHKLSTPLIYEHADSYANNYACVMRDSKYGYLDIDGNECVPCIYDTQEKAERALDALLTPEQREYWDILSNEDRL